MQPPRPVLCEKCQHSVDVPHIRPFRNPEPRFLRSDYWPTETERSELMSIIEEGENQMKQYDEDISVMRKRLERLERAKEDVNVTVMQCHAALSVQRRVPTETLEKIFSILCLSLHEYSFNIRYDSKDSPLLGLPAALISQVCSRWSVVAQGIPEIWSSYNFIMSDPPYNITIPLRTYLLNSKDSLLKIRLERGEPRVTSRIFSAWKMLSSSMYRSREIVLTTFEYKEGPPPVRDLAFPNLISYREERRVDHCPFWLSQALEKAPNLTTIQTHHETMHYLPMPQITVWKLEGECHNLETLFGLLGRCKRLTNLSTELTFGHRGAVPVLVDLPCLQKLSIYLNHWNNRLDFFASLNMPALETCHIAIKSNEWPQMDFLTTVQRPTSLKHLTIMARLLKGRSSMKAFPLFEILKAASQLTHFELYFRRDDNLLMTESKNWRAYMKPIILDSLSQLQNNIVSTILTKLESDSDVFLPNLRFLSVKIPDITLNTRLVERVLEVVTARQATPCPLTDIHIVRLGVGLRRGAEKEQRFVLEPELLKRVEEFEKCGIRVTVGYQFRDYSEGERRLFYEGQFRDGSDDDDGTW